MANAGSEANIESHASASSSYYLKIGWNWESFNITFTDKGWSMTPWNVMSSSKSSSSSGGSEEIISITPENIAFLGTQFAWSLAQLAWNSIFHFSTMESNVKQAFNDWEKSAEGLAKAWKDLINAGGEAIDIVKDALTGQSIDNNAISHAKSLVNDLKKAVSDLETSFVQSVGIQLVGEIDCGIGVGGAIGIAFDWDNFDDFSVYLIVDFSIGAEEGGDVDLALCLNGAKASSVNGTYVGINFDITAGIGGGAGVSISLSNFDFNGISLNLLSVGEELKFGSLEAGSEILIAQGFSDNVPSLNLGDSGYWLLASDGTISEYGNATSNGDGVDSDNQAVDIAVTSDGGGYWVLSPDGGIHTYGDAAYNGHGINGDSTAVALGVTSDGGGYWILCQDGNIHNYGSTDSYGNGVGNTNAVDIAITSDSAGYWLLGEDGTVHPYGNAKDHGHGISGDSKAVALCATPDDGGYWILCEDGGIHTYGNATYYGHGIDQGKKAVDLGTTPDGTGYWIACHDGSIKTYGYATYHGHGKNESVVAIGISPVWEKPQQSLGPSDSNQDQTQSNGNIIVKPQNSNLNYHSGQKWITSSGYKFTFQNDGNLVLYNSSGSAIWASGTDNKGATEFAVQCDGNMVIYADSEAIWATNTSGNSGAYLAIQDDGNVVVYKNDGGICSFNSAIWATDTQGK